jgi:hypothetical protein
MLNFMHLPRQKEGVYIDIYIHICIYIYLYIHIPTTHMNAEFHASSKAVVGRPLERIRDVTS